MVMTSQTPGRGNPGAVRQACWPVPAAGLYFSSVVRRPRARGLLVPPRLRATLAGRAGSNARSVLGRAALSVVAGFVLDMAFPGLGWWFMAPLALGALVLLLASQSLLRGCLLGLAFGLGFFVPHVSWSGVYVGPGPWLALAVLQSLYLAVLGGATSLAGRWLSMTGQALIFPALWVAVEALRARTPFGGFPWGRVAFSQTDGPVLGWAWVGGAPMVSFVVALSGALLAVTATALRPGRAAARAGLVTLPLLAVALLAAGAPLLSVAARNIPVQSVNIAAVQGNVARPGLDFNAERRAVLRNHVDGTLRLARDVRAGRAVAPDLVLWPENSSDIDPLRDPDAAQSITSAAQAVGVPLVVGAVLAEPDVRVSNASLVWSTAGVITDRYVKNRPVPFAEYIPYRPVFRKLTTKVDLVRKDFAPGSGPHTISAAGLRLGVAICFEVAFDDHLRDAVSQGAQLLFVPTNNATFGRTDETLQQLAMSRLRAVELGRGVAQVSTVGVSALIGPDGQFAARGGHFTTETLTARLPVSSARTPALRMGAAMEGAITVVGAGGALVGLLCRGRQPAGPGRAAVGQRPE